MSQALSAYPLHWPSGWRRTESYKRKRANFKSANRNVSVIEGVERVLAELDLLGIRNRNDIVISTNIPTRLDGFPRSDQAEPSDPGAAVYWTQRGQKHPKCVALDRYNRVADNLAAIAASLNAMRAIERHGGAEILDRVFTGFVALPAPEQAWQTLGLSSSRPTRQEIDQAHRRLAFLHHPDRGGDPQHMARINSARDDLYRDLGS